jgi:hypothetical protein
MNERPRKAFMSDRHAIYLQVPVLVAICCCVTPVLAQFGESQIAGAIVLATICSSTMFAAAWAAVGPGWLIVRLPFSFAWAALVGLSADVALLWERNSFINLFGLFASMTSTLWLLAQVPFWSGVLLFDLRLRYQSSNSPAGGGPAKNKPPVRFTILRLMLFTALVAVSLGLGRLSMEHDDINFLKYFGFLFFSQIVVCVPLIYAALWPRWAVVGISACLLGIALFTAAQPSLAKWNEQALVRVSELSLCIAANLTSIGSILLFATLVRCGGYHFGIPAVEAQPSNADTETSAPSISPPSETAR